MTLRTLIVRLILSSVPRFFGDYWSRITAFSPLLKLHYGAHFFVVWNVCAWSLILVQYMSRNLGLSDSQASLVFSLHGAAATLMAMIIGHAIDHIGVFHTVAFAACGSAASKGLFVLIGSGLLPIAENTRVIASIVLLVTVIPACDILMLLVGRIGVKRYSLAAAHVSQYKEASFESFDPETRSTNFEFALRYSFDNVSALVASATLALGNAFFPLDEVSMNRMAILSTIPVLLASAAIAAVGIGRDTYNVSLSISEAISSDIEESVLIREDAAEEMPVHLAGACCLRRWYLAREALVRFIVLALAMIAVKTLFRHQEVTLPKYMQRQFDPNFPYALLMMINPAIVIFLASPIAMGLTRFKPYAVLFSGTLICCAGSLFLMIPHLAPVIISIVIFSVGEVIWSPSLEAFLMNTAPRGKEGAFGALVTLPLFLAAFPVGVLSGYFLEFFCPSAAQCSSSMLWGIVSGCAFFTPLVLVALYPWLSSPTVAESEETQRIAVRALSLAARSQLSGELGETPRTMDKEKMKPL